ncbi:MAG: hypothetical protein HKN43_16580 [Rhodothermales bacterium]|nr:hypothetical protein [Rhodothermales bacterium]
MVFKSGRLLTVILLSVLVGCSSNTGTQFDYLVTVSASTNGEVLDATDAIYLIETLGYKAVRDSIVQKVDSATRIAVAVYEIQPDGSEQLRDSTVQTAADGAGLSWLNQLLPEQLTFAALRNQEMFRYVAIPEPAMEWARIRAEVLPESDMPGGLRSVTLSYQPDQPRLTGVSVVRDGGGLFFTERSSLEVEFRNGSFSGLDNVVVLTLPFKDPVAYRTVASIVSDGSQNASQ